MKWPYHEKSATPLTTNTQREQKMEVQQRNTKFVICHHTLMYLTYSFDKPTREKFSIVSADGLSTTVNTAVGKYQYTMFIERIWMQQNCRQIFVLSLAESNYISDTRNCRDVSHQRFCRIKRPRKTDIHPHVFHSDISYKNVGMISCIPILYFIYECMCNCWKKSCYHYHGYYFVFNLSWADD